jgi:hypothetical protein
MSMLLHSACPLTKASWDKKSHINPSADAKMSNAVSAHLYSEGDSLKLVLAFNDSVAPAGGHHVADPGAPDSSDQGATSQALVASGNKTGLADSSEHKEYRTTASMKDAHPPTLVCLRQEKRMHLQILFQSAQI